MQKNSAFKKEKERKQRETLDNIFDKLPEMAKRYLIDKSLSTTIVTRISYGYDLLIFFNFLIKTNPDYSDYSPNKFTVSELNDLTSYDFDEYRNYLLDSHQYDRKSSLSNSPRSVAKKFAAVRGLFTYLYVKEEISKNPTVNVTIPTAKKAKSVIFLEDNEIHKLLDIIENGPVNISEHQKAYFKKTKLRDKALIYVLLGSGIRVSECQGLDIQDIDFDEMCFPVIRKGEHPDMVYFGEDVKNALYDYINISRINSKIKPGHEEALFLSMQGTRMSIDAIENTVSKYANVICTNKHITVHKLRSTFGTHFYNSNGNDLIATQHAMGHENPNTTSIYIGEIEKAKKGARNIDYKKN